MPSLSRTGYGGGDTSCDASGDEAGSVLEPGEAVGVELVDEISGPVDLPRAGDEGRALTGGE